MSLIIYTADKKITVKDNSVFLSLKDPQSETNFICPPSPTFHRPLSPIPNACTMDVTEFIQNTIEEAKKHTICKTEDEERPKKIIKVEKPIRPLKNYDFIPPVTSARNEKNCPWFADCSMGLYCKKLHSQKERNMFFLRQRHPNDSIKTRLCRFYYSGAKCDPKQCIYAHGLQDMICELCHEYGHGMNTCLDRRN